MSTVPFMSSFTRNQRDWCHQWRCTSSLST